MCVRVYVYIRATHTLRAQCARNQWNINKVEY